MFYRFILINSFILKFIFGIEGNFVMKSKREVFFKKINSIDFIRELKLDFLRIDKLELFKKILILERFSKVFSFYVFIDGKGTKKDNFFSDTFTSRFLNAFLISFFISDFSRKIVKTKF